MARMALVSDAFFLPTGDPGRFVATPHTEGLWVPAAMHGGPPSALLIRTVERLPSTIAGPAQVARFTVEILGPMPTGEIAVSAAVARSGRSVELVEAELVAGGRPAMRARIWRIRTADLDLPSAVPAGPVSLPPTRPAEETPVASQYAARGFLGAVEWRFVDGRFDLPGPSVVWARLRVPVVDGEQPTPLQRLLTLADCGNGLSSRYDFDAWWFINTELTVHLHRPPAGEWFCARADATMDRTGVGLAETELFDDHGRVGRGAQALLVGPRS
jgi:hypothetical protein